MATPQLGNCPKCRKLFLRTIDICPECYQKQEEEYLKAAAYLRDYPGSSIQELCDETEISVAQIRQFILTGRIIVDHFSNLSYPCESCGSLIRTGRKCNSCMVTLDQLASQVEKGNGVKKEDHSYEKNGKSGGYISRYL